MIVTIYNIIGLFKQRGGFEGNVGNRERSLTFPSCLELHTDILCKHDPPIADVDSYKCDALRDLVPFAQFKKREKHSWRGVNFSKG